MKVICFEPGYDEKHRTVLRALAAGIPGAEVCPLGAYEPCDVAVIFGLVKRAYKATWAKQPVLDRHRGDRLLVVESAFVRRGDYWAMGWGGINGRADFRSASVGDDRWRAMGVKTRPWRSPRDAKASRLGPVVVCGQLPRDTNVQDTDHPAWCRHVMAWLAAERIPAVFRPHPRIDDPEVYGIAPALWDTGKIAETLAWARAAVVFNSTSGVDAALAGVPVVALDRGAFCWPIASHRLDVLRDPGSSPGAGPGSSPGAGPRCPSRRAWLAGLGYSQWTLEEMRAGLPWRHLTRALGDDG
ncbi:MAG TPA: hypothetical protein VGB88_06220 [Alphaproteobacteria bacterium]